MAKIYLLKNFWVEGYGNYSYHSLSVDDLIEGTTYYVSVYDDMTTDGAVLGSHTHSTYEWSGSLNCGSITIEFGDPYVYINDSSSPFYDSGVYINLYYEDDESANPDTPTSSVTASITLNATTGIATWSYSATDGSDISFNEPYIQLWDLNDMITNTEGGNSYDFSEFMSSGGQYYATLKISYYNYSTDSNGEVTAHSETITYSPISTPTVSVVLSNKGLATATISGSGIEYVYFYLYKGSSASGTAIANSGLGVENSSTWDCSSHMSSGQTYCVKCVVHYYLNGSSGDMGSVSATSSAVTYSPSSTSFAARMAAIREAICLKASTSGNMTINTMIATLNDLNTTGSSIDISNYNDEDFDTCMTMLANVIRAKGNTSAKLTIAQMPAAINAITLASTNPLTINIYVHSDISAIEISSNANAYGAPSGTITWYDINGNYLYDESLSNGVDGGYYYFNKSGWSEITVYASIYIASGDYSIRGTSDTFYIPDQSGGGSGSGWDYSELWYYMGEWHTSNPSENTAWQSTTCSNCNATVYTDSIGTSAYCNNYNSSTGNTCNNYLYWSENTTLYYCWYPLGEDMYCGRSGSESEGCPEHGFYDWRQGEQP